MTETDGRAGGASGVRRAGPGERPGPAPAMGILEKISEIEKEIARTQKNKGPGRRGGSGAVGG